ncbi:hypothetical protein [Streptomyces sp. NPDC059788]|uniref:hypothetical protein n=1 Tax=Streptomyces sp. NPDC059788 TaxID=3346948 RepID=UPI00364BD9A7
MGQRKRPAILTAAVPSLHVPAQHLMRPLQHPPGLYRGGTGRAEQGGQWNSNLFVRRSTGPRLPVITAGEARAAVALLAHYGRGGDEAARLARRWSANVARRLPAE